MNSVAAEAAKLLARAATEPLSPITRFDRRTVVVRQLSHRFDQSS
jgi:hypothetical protein